MIQVYVVVSDDCNEGDCDCVHESIVDVFFDKEMADTCAKTQCYGGRVQIHTVREKGPKISITVPKVVEGQKKGTCTYCGKKAPLDVLRTNCGACAKKGCIIEAMRDNL